MIDSHFFHIDMLSPHGFDYMEIVSRDFEFSRWQKKPPLLRVQKQSLHAIDFVTIGKIFPFLVQRAFKFENLNLKVRKELEKLPNKEKWINEMLVLVSVECQRQRLARKRVCISERFFSYEIIQKQLKKKWILIRFLCFPYIYRIVF